MPRSMPTLGLSRPRHGLERVLLLGMNITSSGPDIAVASQVLEREDTHVQVDRLFGLITDRMIRRGTFHCVDELERAIYQWLANWNNEPRPFVWKATADVILDKIRRCPEAIVNS